MTNKQYLEKMRALGLKRWAPDNAEPENAVECNKVIDEINRTNRAWLYSRRRRSWYSFLIILFMLLCLAWTVWSILFKI